MKLTIYHYPKCGTCRKAIAWLEGRGHELTKIDISLNPPAANELQAWIEQNGIELKSLYNVSGQVYRQMNLKEKREQMTVEEQLDLLASNGMLIKRPIVTDGNNTTVGFREEEFEKNWG